MSEDDVVDSTVHDDEADESTDFEEYSDSPDEDSSGSSDSSSSSGSEYSDSDSDGDDWSYDLPPKPRPEVPILVPYEVDELNSEANLQIDFSNEEADDPSSDQEELDELIDIVGENAEESDLDSEDDREEETPQEQDLNDPFPPVSLTTALAPAMAKVTDISLLPARPYRPRLMFPTEDDHLLVQENDRHHGHGDFSFIDRTISSEEGSSEEVDESEPEPKRPKRRRDKPSRMRMKSEFLSSESSDDEEDYEKPSTSASTLDLDISNGVSSSTNIVNTPPIESPPAVPAMQTPQAAPRNSPKQVTPDSCTPNFPTPSNSTVLRLRRNGDQYTVELTGRTPVLSEAMQTILEKLPFGTEVGSRFTFWEGDKRFKVQQFFVPENDGATTMNIPLYYYKPIDIDGNDLSVNYTLVKKSRLVEKFERIVMDGGADTPIDVD